MKNLIQYLKIHKVCKTNYVYEKFFNKEIENILNTYNLTLGELIYRLTHNISLSDKFVCRFCGKPVKFNRTRGYRKACSKKCSLTHINKSQEHIEKVKKTTQEHYGVDNYAKTDEYKIKRERECMKKYGVASHNKVDSCKQKARLTCIELYNTPWYASTQECKDRRKKTCNKLYGADHYSQSEERKLREPDIQKKRLETMRENNSFCKSSFEEKVYQLLLLKFSEQDIMRQYKNEDYPFACDFYIKSLNLYIECNGHWSHGKFKGKILGSFNNSDPEHLSILNIWIEKAKKSKYYANAVHVWTDLDVRKLETFKKNKLNYKIFWTLKEAQSWIDSL